MSHIVESCPLTKLNSSLSRLHSADEDAVSLLTNYGSWHAYEKKVVFCCVYLRALTLELLTNRLRHLYCEAVKCIGCLFSYILHIQSVEVCLQALEEDFVESRREGPDQMTVDDFHSLLTLARLEPRW